jgi:hypothetical protein
VIAQRAFVVAGGAREEKQIRVSGGDGKELSGTYTVIGGVITVTAENGRQLRTQLGTAPAEAVAKIMLRELARQRPQ